MQFVRLKTKVAVTAADEHTQRDAYGDDAAGVFQYEPRQTIHLFQPEKYGAG
ncbi:MAG: hypothetical protein ACK6DC_12845 [Planctomycetota bacterium]